MRDATCTILTGDADAANTFEQPKAVIPVQLDFKAEKEFAYAASPMSLTVIRIKTK
jgi:alpha-L-arabinofuranosidase